MGWDGMGWDGVWCWGMMDVLLMLCRGMSEGVGFVGERWIK